MEPPIGLKLTFVGERGEHVKQVYAGTDGHPSADPAAQLLSSHQFPSSLERAILFFFFFLMRGAKGHALISEPFRGKCPVGFCQFAHHWLSIARVWPEKYRRSCW